MTFLKPEFGHTFQHFLQGYLPFYSSILWINRLDGIGNVDYMDYLVLDYSNKRLDFWNRHDGFIKAFLKSIHNIHTKAIVPPSCITSTKNNLKTNTHSNTVTITQPITLLTNASFYYFAHPSDAYSLVNEVLSLDPCRLSNAAPTMLQETRIVIVERAYNRKIKNLQHVVDMVASIHPTYTPPNIVVFDMMSMQQQLDIITQTDILIFAHGAAQANLAFANPCTGVIEVLPYGYCTAFFYKDLYKSIDAIAYSWYDDRPQDYNHDATCNKVVQGSALVTNSSCHVSYSKSTAARQCLRKMDIHIDTDVLRVNMIRIMREREKCIQTHPFLNRSSVL